VGVVEQEEECFGGVRPRRVGGEGRKEEDGEMEWKKKKRRGRRRQVEEVGGDRDG
jgi:hypothetical protein